MRAHDEPEVQRSSGAALEPRRGAGPEASADPSPAAAPPAPRGAALVPPALALAVLVGVQVIAQLAQIGHPRAGDAGRYVAPDPVPPVEKARGDFLVLLWGGRAFAEGNTTFRDVNAFCRLHDPWHRGFVYPPLVYVVLAPVGLLADSVASWFWLLASALVFPLCLGAWVWRSFRSLGTASTSVLLLSLLCFGLSASTLLEMERGNYNWLVCSLYLVALLLLSRQRAVASGAVLGLAVALKIFPAVALPMLLVLRRWKAAAASALTVAGVVLATGPGSNLECAQLLSSVRLPWTSVCGWNTSLYNGLAYLAGRRGGPWLAPASLALYALAFAAFCLAVHLRVRRGQAPAADRVLALLLPFMFLIPAASWSYTLFSLVALLPVLSELSLTDPRLRPWTYAAAALVGLCQSPLVALVLRGDCRALTPVLSLATAGLALLAPILVAGRRGQVPPGGGLADSASASGRASRERRV